MLTKKLLKTINYVEYVSFDIFDTLIKRNFELPVDVFKYIEEKYNYPDFYNRRIEAEKKCRLNFNGKEIKLDDIYLFLHEFYTEKELNKLKNLEISVEIECCVLNPNITEILNECNKLQKKIIIISDMYLPLEVVEKILSKNNINYCKLYLSSNIGLTKSSGNLFRFVLNDLSIKPFKIIHIGDNLKSDYLNSKKYGIKSFKIDTEVINITHYDNPSNLDEKMLKFFINNKLNCNSTYFYQFGYSILGPLLFSFSKWLNQNFKSDNVNKVLFLSRDGFIMKKAYDTIFPNDNNIYFYASRRALIVPSFIYCDKIQDLFKCMYFEEKVYVKSIIKGFGLEINNNDVIKLLEKFDINPNEQIITNDLFLNKNKYCNFFKELFPLILVESRKEHDAFLSYFKKNILKCSNVAIVDIGWFGNMQNALEKIIINEKINCKLNGYYVGLAPENINQDKYKMKGFLFDKFNNSFYHEFERRYNSIFETMFLANHGSLIKYVLDDDKRVCFEFNDYENSKNLENILEFQEAALDFVRDMKNYNLDINFDNINLNSVLKDFGTNPNIQDSINWGNIEFESGNTENFIAKPKSGWEYIFFPKSLINDFNSSYWKIGFLKRIFKINIDYNKIYEFLRKLVKR